MSRDDIRVIWEALFAMSVARYSYDEDGNLEEEYREEWNTICAAMDRISAPLGGTVEVVK